MEAHFLASFLGAKERKQENASVMMAEISKSSNHSQDVNQMLRSAADSGSGDSGGSLCQTFCMAAMQSSQSNAIDHD